MKKEATDAGVFGTTVTASVNVTPSLARRAIAGVRAFVSNGSTWSRRAVSTSTQSTLGPSERAGRSAAPASTVAATSSSARRPGRFADASLPKDGRDRSRGDPKEKGPRGRNRHIRQTACLATDAHRQDRHPPQPAAHGRAAAEPAPGGQPGEDQAGQERPPSPLRRPVCEQRPTDRDAGHPEAENERRHEAIANTESQEGAQAQPECEVEGNDGCRGGEGREETRSGEVGHQHVVPCDRGAIQEADRQRDEGELTVPGHGEPGFWCGSGTRENRVRSSDQAIMSSQISNSR